MLLPRRRTLLAVAVAATLAGLGCSESPTVATDRQARPRLSTAPRERPSHSDEYLAKVADRVSGFAAFYLRGDTLVLRVKGEVGGGAVATALRQALRNDPDIARFRDLPRRLGEGPVVVEPSRYDARELWGFRVRALQQVFGNGVHRLDQDETHGVIRIGVDSAADMSEVEARVLVAGIPADAVVLEVRERGRRETTLRDRLRPLPGGMKLQVEDRAPCTMTVNAFMSESEEWGFFTCSHCTSSFGGAYGDAAYQNVNGYGNVVGWEILDPALWAPGEGYCPWDVAGCRYSDAALFVYQSSSYPDSMTIARTTNSSGSITIDGNHPRFAVTGPVEYLPVGLDVDKIGQATGWTTGEVTATCVDKELDNIVTFCSWVADYESDAGDSGSPVFTWDGSSWTVGLVGIHWGRAGSSRYFSPWLYIVLEIGGELQEDLFIEY